MQSVGIAHTDAGRARESNEDAILVDDALGVYAVCDGAGGHDAGALASATCVDVARRVFAASTDVIERARSGRAPLADLVAVAERSVKDASREVFRIALANARPMRMASTMTLLVAAGTRGVVAHVGDSRLYRIRDGSAEQLTRDHTLLEQYEALGGVPPHLDRERLAQGLTRAVGADEDVDVDTRVLELARDDLFLLCSDGLGRYIDRPDTLVRHLDGCFEEIPRRLVDLANACGGSDDVSVVAIRID